METRRSWQERQGAPRGTGRSSDAVAHASGTRDDGVCRRCSTCRQDPSLWVDLGICVPSLVAQGSQEL